MNDRHEFSAAEIISLLARLDERLRARGVSAAVFIVGGAAIAATSNRESSACRRAARSSYGLGGDASGSTGLQRLAACRRAPAATSC